MKNKNSCRRIALAYLHVVIVHREPVDTIEIPIEQELIFTAISGSMVTGKTCRFPAVSKRRPEYFVKECV